MSNTQDKDIKEEFCGACLAIPVALAGAGAAGYGSKKGSYKTLKKVAFIGGLTVTFIALGISIYFICRCKECNE
jgi:cytochrome c biogenesis protein CcdA